MSRNALYNVLIADPILNGFGLNEDTVFPNFNNEERPVEGMFAILRWGEQDRRPFRDTKAPERLTVWVHYPRELSNDFNRLIKVLDRIDEVLDDARDIVGSDDYTLSFVDTGGRSRDLVDDGFNTITKTADYQVHSRRS